MIYVEISLKLKKVLCEEEDRFCGEEAICRGLKESVGETREELEFLEAKPFPFNLGGGSGNDTISEEGVSGTELAPLAEEGCPVVDGQAIRPSGT